MFYIRSEASFDSAHFLKGYQGKCSNLHGHRWCVTAQVRGEELVEEGQEKGMLMDFGDLKAALRDLCDSLDHCLIYEEGTLKERTEEALREEGFRLVTVPFRPTAEKFAEYFYRKLAEKGLPVHRIEVYETPGNCAVYED